MKHNTDTCLSGYGVVCGTEVHVAPDCSIEVDEGTLIFTDGDVKHIARQHFRYYMKPEHMNEQVKKFMLSFLKMNESAETANEFWQLAPDSADPQTVDSLKQQHPGDMPKHNLMWNKVMVVLAFTDEEQKTTLYWLLVSRNALAARQGIGSMTPSDNQGLFSRVITRKEIDTITVDEYLRPVLKLPLLYVPRFGYKGLALIQPAVGLSDDNLAYPFLQVNSFSEIFFEYKAIIDDYILVFRDALNVLHTLYGPMLSHKGAEYLERYRKFLMLKVKMFYEEGEHLYYIQYIYDWLRDLTTAFNELVSKLNGFRGGCPCSKLQHDGPKGSLLMLGPVMGSRSTYQPLIFRDLADAAETDRSIREVRCLHWRLLMMIRTFDLPFLHLHKVVDNETGEPGIEEKLDSTDYWEFINSLPPEHTAGDNKLPIKFTPSQGSTVPIGKQAIPYYYPIDSNSIYAVHQFWDYETTMLRRTDTHLSYNAYAGDPDKPSTDTVNDCYTTRTEVILPLAFDIEPYPWLRPEGHIGKLITVSANTMAFYFASFPLMEYLVKYNLCVDVVAVGLPGGETSLSLERICGLEHRPALQQGQTLVLFFVSGDNEQIELQECRKDEKPEVKQFCVVADFVLPYRYSCCAEVTLPLLKLMARP